MMLWLFASFLLVSAFLLMSVLFLLLALLRDQFIVRVPFISTRPRAVPHILDALKLTPGSVLVDLGCGNGHILKEAKKNHSDITAVGYERGIIPFIVAKARSRRAGVEILFKDIFDVDLARTTHVYCYLLPHVLEKLEPKLLKEGRSGLRVVTCDYVFPNLVPVETRSVGIASDPLSKKLYVYELS